MKQDNFKIATSLETVAAFKPLISFTPVGKLLPLRGQDLARVIAHTMKRTPSRSPSVIDG